MRHGEPDTEARSLRNGTVNRNLTVMGLRNSDMKIDESLFCREIKRHVRAVGAREESLLFHTFAGFHASHVSAHLDEEEPASVEVQLMFASR
jgi:hypothetical protein